ncbi:MULTISPECIES: helix-turn-helix domain-containing protein [Chryseobacterium]|uniref:helix-turn-helix domain-containing protein n=1 Tax=Chryseobacterium TaxID=59732 RepID=UPI00195C525B|nr:MULTISPECIES: helix-turn-helix domain-containing protein [Chryseobacterium]MBM7419463.1 AraC-like DNA-binding protein [Chryseobacterium sp. JUb44]MDH6209391.1 AraC-like DNA-binding protein [Chryseobacterium sp. BIGb0186]WSO12227.1 helix-turn-helix domain-containing protein [Chryseobacterium scophthalmum]
MIYTTLLNIAIFQGIVLGIVILKSSLFNSQSNKYLAYLLFALSIVLLNYVFEIEGAFTSYPLLCFLDYIEWIFLLPVFIFLFIIHRIDDTVKNRQKTYLYYIPFVYSSTFTITYHLNDILGIYKITDSDIFIINILRLIQLLFAFIIILFPPFYSYFMIRHLKDPQEKNWVLTLLTALYLVLSTWLITYMAGFFFEVDISSTMSVLALCATFIIHWTAYIGIYKYKLAKNKDAVYNFLNNDLAIIHPNLQVSENSIMQENSIVEAYKESITADNLYFQKLELLCKEQHIYTDSTLNREKVAEKLGISAGYVSQIVNTITGDNFANYINNYRVEAVKEMISDPEYENYTLLTMGLESGFTSKTTFYKAFKKVTDQTPNEYKNNIK